MPMNSKGFIKSVKEKSECSDSFYLEEKLANLPPSKEILSFYRKQIKSLEDENVSINKKLEQYKTLCNDYHISLTTVNKHQFEIHHLQRNLSELQDCLFQEKEITTKLKAQLLNMESDRSSRPEHSKENSYYPLKLNENCDFDSYEKSYKRSTCNSKLENEKILEMQVESLRNQLINQSLSSKERFESMMTVQNDRTKQTEERIKDDEEGINMLTNKLNRAQDMLYENTKELLELRDARRDEETRWMEEKEKLMKEMKLAKDKAVNALKQSLQVAERKLKDSENKNDLLRERLQILEEELTNSKEEFGAVNDGLQAKLEHTTNLLNVLNKRHKDFQVRKSLEIEGYKTEINLNKIKLENSENQFYKVAVAYSKDLGLFDDDNEDGGGGGEAHKTKEIKNKSDMKFKRKVFTPRPKSPANHVLTKSHINVLKKRY